MKSLATFLCLFFGVTLIAQEIPKKKNQKSFIQVDYLPIEMPVIMDRQEPNMGIVGTHYNINFGNFYTGLGLYSAVSGERGGFFTLGANLGYKHNITNRLFIDSGVHLGAGGGDGTPDGGGVFILPKLNLGIDFNSFSVFGGYSYINFFDEGRIESDQIYFGFLLPIKSSYSTDLHKKQYFTYKNLKETDWNTQSSDISVLIHLNNLKVKGKSHLTDGTSINGETIRLAGAEFSKYISNNWLLFFRADGAYKGVEPGFMDFFVGTGYKLSMFQNKTNLVAKFGIGAGGGGGIETQGGFLINPDISLEQHITNGVYATANTGIIMRPNADFKASSFGFGLKYYTQINGIDKENPNLDYTFKTIEFILKEDVYFNAKRKLNPTENLYQFSFQVNYNLNQSIYAAGQTSFANFGNAGAYAEGLVGVGIKSFLNTSKSLSLFGQVLGGGAGGGQISTGKGFIVKPSVGLNVGLSQLLNLRVSGGYVKAKGGELNSSMLNIGLSYNFSILKSK